MLLEAGGSGWVEQALPPLLACLSAGSSREAILVSRTS